MAGPGDTERRILAIERMLMTLSGRVTPLEPRLSRLGQRVWAGWTPIGGGEPSRCAVVTFSIRGWNFHLMPGFGITFSEAGQPTFSATTDGSGVATVGFSATGDWNLGATTEAARFDFSAVNPFAEVCGTDDGRTVHLAAATGYHYPDQTGPDPGTNYPLKDTLNLSLSTGDACALTWVATGLGLLGGWQGTFNRTVNGSVLCPPGATVPVSVPVSFIFGAHGANLQCGYKQCGGVASPAGSFATVFAANGTRTSVADPPSFSTTYTFSLPAIFGVGTVTATIAE